MKKPLNPSAAEYKPIPPGIFPDPNAPPPFFFPPPPSPQPSSPPPPSFEPPHPPLFLSSSQIFTYIPVSSPQPIYTNFSTTNYYVKPHIPAATNPSPPPPRPPRPCAPARTRYGQPERGCSRQRGGFRVGVEGGRENCSRRFEKNGKAVMFNRQENYTDGFCRGGDKKFIRRSMQQRLERENNRHKVMPLKPDEQITTIMIRNIPYCCPREYLIKFLDDFCSLENAKANEEGTSHKQAADVDLQHLNNAYDYLYLPMDFRTKNSRGFAFVNFTNARAALNFADRFHQKEYYWGFVQFDEWPKKIEVARADIQGKEAAVKHASETNYECETDEFLPVCFDPPRDGSRQPVKLTVIGNRRAASEYH